MRHPARVSATARGTIATSTLRPEGQIHEEGPAAQGVSQADIMKRRRAKEEQALKLKNPNFFISRTRLQVRNVPPEVDQKELKKIFLEAVKKRATQANPRVLHAKLLYDPTRPDAEGKPRSRGIGFVEFAEHEHALVALRALNNNPEVFNKARRPIIEFAVEDARAVKKLERRRDGLKQKQNQYDADRKAKANAEAAATAAKGAREAPREKRMARAPTVRPRTARTGTRTAPRARPSPSPRTRTRSPRLAARSAGPSARLSSRRWGPVRVQGRAQSRKNRRAESRENRRLERLSGQTGGAMADTGLSRRGTRRARAAGTTSAIADELADRSAEKRDEMIFANRATYSATVQPTRRRQRSPIPFRRTADLDGDILCNSGASSSSFSASGSRSNPPPGLPPDRSHQRYPHPPVFIVYTRRAGRRGHRRGIRDGPYAHG